MNLPRPTQRYMATEQTSKNNRYTNDMEFKKQPMTSATHSEFTLEALRQIAPSAFTEVRGADGELTQKVDFKVLRELLGDAIADADEESFGFQWVGKQEAKRAAAEPTRQTLRPVVDDSVDWDTTENLYIEGDNLEVLKLLQRAYLGKVKMIYIDPPYNTGNDFVYEDDFAMSGEEMDEAMGNVDEEGNRLRRNLDSNPRYHSDWCSMIYSRLLVARTLLANDGVIFISIDDNEVHHLRKICDEVFGAGNFLAQVIWERAYAPINLMKHFSPSHDYIVCYAKDVDLAKCNGIPRSSEADARYSNPDNDPRGVWQSDNLSVGPAIEANIYPITTPSGRVVEPPAGRSWSPLPARRRAGGGGERPAGGGWGVPGGIPAAGRLRQNRIWFGSDGNGVPRMKRFLSELRKTGVTPMTIWKYEEVGHSQDATKALAGIFDGKKYFDYPKPVDLIKRCISLYSSPDSLILDFFSGSATTAHAVMQLNAEDGGKRKYICVQLPEETPEGSEARKAGYNTICEIGKERIRRAGKKIKEEAGLMGQDLDTGFRVLRTDSSNMEEVYFEPAGLEQQNLFTQVDSVKIDRSELDLLFGCMVDWGVELSYPLRTEEVDGKHLHIVNEGALVACFDKEISVEAVSRIAELKPLRVIFREECFATDADKLNIYEKFKQFCGWNDEEVYKRIHVL